MYCMFDVTCQLSLHTQPENKHEGWHLYTFILFQPYTHTAAMV